MDNLLAIAFEAHHFKRNHHRYYSIRIGRDLFGDWTVTVGHGRAGRSGRETYFASPDANELQAHIRQRLKRRLSAPRRIGCAYRLVLLDTAAGLDPTAWLPDEIISKMLAID